MLHPVPLLVQPGHAQRRVPSIRVARPSTCRRPGEGALAGEDGGVG